MRILKFLFVFLSLVSACGETSTLEENGAAVQNDQSSVIYPGIAEECYNRCGNYSILRRNENPLRDISKYMVFREAVGQSTQDSRFLECGLQSVEDSVSIIPAYFDGDNADKQPNHGFKYCAVSKSTKKWPLKSSQAEWLTTNLFQEFFEVELDFNLERRLLVRNKKPIPGYGLIARAPAGTTPAQIAKWKTQLEAEIGEQLTLRIAPDCIYEKLELCVMDEANAKNIIVSTDPINRTSRHYCQSTYQDRLAVSYNVLIDDAQVTVIKSDKQSLSVVGGAALCVIKPQ